MNNRGVTLTELIIVVAIIGILAAIAIPAYIGQQTRAARTEGFSNLESLRLLEEQFFAENGCYYRSGGNCTNATITGVANIQASLPGFKPGNEASLNFTYSITTSGTPAASAFTATATGAGGRIPATEVYTIDNNNNKNF